MVHAQPPKNPITDDMVLDARRDDITKWRSKLCRNCLKVREDENAKTDFSEEAEEKLRDGIVREHDGISVLKKACY